MKKIFLIINLSLVLFFVYPSLTLANIVCNDGTISPSCGDCHKGCCSKHGGCSTSNSSSSSNNKKPDSSNKKPTVTEKIKNSDATLKKVTVDDENISILENMTYNTTKDNVNLLVVANDSQAKVDYPSNVDLTIGENIINILVTAENGNTKKYTLNITREKILSNNKNIKIFVDGNEITFNSFKSEIIPIGNEKNDINITYELEDSNAYAEIIGNENLKVGYNEIIIKVTAENKEEQKYMIIVRKEEKKVEQEEVEETKPEVDNNNNNNQVVTFEADSEGNNFNNLVIYLSFGFYGGLGYFVYRKLKK